MPCRSEPYDPYLPRGGSSANPAGAGGSNGPTANPKTAAIQQQIDDTVGIMRDNITKVAERGELGAAGFPHADLPVCDNV